jgi:hypothetical protein
MTIVHIKYISAISTTLPTPTETCVAFSAYLSVSEAHPGRHQTIIFDSLLTNVGSHYNQHNGVFTVPKSGSYVFSWRIGCDANEYIFTDIVVNSSIKSATRVDGRGLQAYTSTVGLVVLQVNKNDIVYIRTNSANDISGRIVSYHDNRATFSGWFLG